MKETNISWTDSTFNPWIGCTRVSPGCVHCYAEAYAKRYGKAEWGPTAKRVKTSVDYWKQPLKWNKDEWFECPDCGWRGSRKDTYIAEIVGLQTMEKRCCPICLPTNNLVEVQPTRQRVFCASLADVFEVNPQVMNWRGELFQLMEQTPNLDWLLLTKRPEKIFSEGTSAVGEVFDNWMGRNPNVWLGTTVESQEYFEPRVTALLSVYAKVHFLSVEPMVGPVRLPNKGLPAWMNLDWVICGGESGAGCRQMDIEWARDLRADCQAGGVKFFMKQLGGHPSKRDKLENFPADLRIREFPQ